MSASVTQPVAPPTPQEIQRKLSLKSASSPVPITPGGSKRRSRQQPIEGVSGPESDSDGPSGSYFSPPQTTAVGDLSTSQPPLGVITERLNADGEESDDDEEGGEWQAPATPSEFDDHNHDDAVIKSGYLWKKGERRKNWKKRWFVLRTSKLALYKNSQEYELSRILDMHDVHSATVVSLKRHINTFGVVTPTRTYYLQAENSDDCHAWVKALNDVRNKLREEDFTPAQTPRTSSVGAIPIPSSSAGGSGVKRSMSTTGKGSNLPAIITSSPTPDDGPIQPMVISGRQPGPFPHSPTSPIGLSSDDEDPFTASQSQALAGAVNIANSAGGPQPLDPNHVILSGYLMKCGSKRKTWHKRWFMLTGDRIAYSKSHIDLKHMKHVALDKVVDAIEYTPEVKDAKHHHHQGASGSSGVPGSAEKGSLGGQPASLGATSNFSEAGTSTIAGSVRSGAGGGGGSSSHPQNTFKIITTQRPFLLSAPSEEEEIRWLSAVRALIARRS